MRLTATKYDEIEIILSGVSQRADPDVGISHDYTEDHDVEAVMFHGQDLFEGLSGGARAALTARILEILGDDRVHEALVENAF